MRFPKRAKYSYGNFTGAPIDFWFVEINPVGHVNHSRIEDLAIKLKRGIFSCVNPSVCRAHPL